jgi:hypothetical protein
MSEQSFVSLHRFHRAAYKQSKAPFNSINIATVIIFSHKAQYPLTAKDQHTMANSFVVPQFLQANAGTVS